MEASSTKNVLEVKDTESNQVVTDCLRTPVILRILLQHFSNAKLLKLSLVNKLWNHEARSVLRRRGNLIAKITTLRHPCQDLKAFESDLSAMSVVPFSGIKFDRLAWCHDSDGCLGSSVGTGPVPSYDMLLDRTQWKSLYATFSSYFNYVRCEICPGLLLLKLVFCRSSVDLENLTLGIQFAQRYFFEQVLQDSSLPRLKILKLRDTYETASEEYTRSIKLLVSRAPNLQELHIGGRVNLKENLLEGSSALLFTFKSVSPSVEDISDSIVEKLRMARVKLREIDQNLSLQRISMLTPMLLQRSHATLHSMKIDAVFLAPLMCYGICLNNVTYLRINFHYRQPLRPRIRTLVKQFDFARIFPSLTKVDCIVLRYHLAHLQSQIIEMVEPYYPAVDEPSPHRAANITDLRLYYDSHIPAHRCHAGMLPEMFPHIVTLSVNPPKEDSLPSFIWNQHWKELREIRVEKIGSCAPENSNLDSIFCGIFPEEVAELRQKDEEYLKAVNLVPVMPSIVCMKGLRSFTFSGKSCFYPRREANASSIGNVPIEIISKVAGLVAFRRYPDLSVTLETDTDVTKEGLDHMQPYADVICRYREVVFGPDLRDPLQ